MPYAHLCYAKYGLHLFLSASHMFITLLYRMPLPYHQPFAIIYDKKHHLERK